MKKKKYRVYGIVSASVVLGEYEAKNEEEAQDMANDYPKANWNISVCHHCARELDIGDVYDVQIEEVEES